jgi:arabinofuranosyltransferase
MLPVHLPVAVIAVGGWLHRWTDEDAFINFRIVDNLFAGDGPVFNAGERVETATSPLWLGILAVGRALLGWGVAIEWIAVVLGLAAAIAAFALAGRGAVVAAHGHAAAADADATVVPLGLLAVSSVAVVWDFATSGLEMSLVWLWIAGCWYVLCRAARGGQPTGRRRAGAAAVIGLAPLVRPDLGLMMVCGAAAWFVLVRPRRIAFDLTAMFALPVAYQVFRMGYYATLVPSTALAKDAGGLHADQGWDYVRDLAGPYRLWLPVAVVVATIVVRTRTERDRRVATATLAMVGAAVLHAGYIVAIGGDYMHGRLLLPALFALAVPAYVVVRRADLPSLGLCTLTAVWALVAIVAFRPPTPPPTGIPRIADWRQLTDARVVPLEVAVRSDGTTASELYDSGVRGYMKVLTPGVEPGRDPDALVVVLGAIGVVGYQLGPEVTIVDIGGLAEPIAARTDADPSTLAGHRKLVDVAWYDARFGVVGDDPAAQDAARALRCAPIADLLDAITDDLTPGRFLANIWHSPANTRLHIPADPRRAVAELC